MPFLCHKKTISGIGKYTYLQLSIEVIHIRNRKIVSSKVQMDEIFPKLKLCCRGSRYHMPPFQFQLTIPMEIKSLHDNLSLIIIHNDPLVCSLHMQAI